MIKIEKINNKGNIKNFIVYNPAYHEDYGYNYRIILIFFNLFKFINLVI